MNAPATFQRLMDKVLKGLTWVQCLVYIDDILVFAKNFEDHVVALRKVLIRIRDSGLKLKPAKCIFGDRQVDYLGFTLSDEGLTPSKKKVEKLLRVLPPETNKVLHSFLCAMNFYRNEIPNFGKLTVDLYDMSNAKGRLCKWKPETLNDFDVLKQTLASTPVLVYPNFNKPIIIQGDASKKSIGGACMQSSNDYTDVARSICKTKAFLGGNCRLWNSDILWLKGNY